MLRIILALLLAATPLFAAGKYELLMHRPYTVGQRLALTGKASFENVTTVSANGNLLKEDKLAAMCIVGGETEILALCANGKVAAVKLKISQFVGKENGVPSEIFKVGDVIESKRDNERKTEVIVNGNKATPTQSELIRGLLPSSAEDSATDDDIFGPGKKIEVGDEWNVNSRRAAKDAAAEGIEGIKPEDIKGTCKLTEITEKDGQKCLHVTLLMGIKASGMPLPNTPPEIKIKTMDIQTYADGNFPVDPKSPYCNDRIGETVDMNASGEIVEKNGERMKLEITMHRKKARELELKPLK